MIAGLDAAIAAAGQTIKLRPDNELTGQITLKAHVRMVKPADELIENLKQGDKIVRVSPTGLGNYVPAQNHVVMIAGKKHVVIAAPEFIYAQDTLVRVHMVARG